ncbi:MAG: hypothetical protein QM699_00760 [Amaricoccus sp.]|uniref:hypothetical protein n=1 Tax=Amaricoccus sp. TaxID=1872485 RepID=UPI0039E64EAC
MLTALALLFAGPAFAQDLPPYLDDRSDPAALVRSYYNAVARHEYARAYGYLETPPDYPAFSAGYADTATVGIALGPVTTEGAAGSIYGTVPVAVRATSASGAVTTFAGCYTTRQVQPSIQEPPFRPIGITAGHLAPVGAAGPLADAVPASCPQGE